MENDLREANEKMRKLAVERWKADVEGLRISDTSQASCESGQCHMRNAPKVKLDVALRPMLEAH